MLCAVVVLCNMYVVSFMSSITSRMECSGCLVMDIWDGWIMFVQCTCMCSMIDDLYQDVPTMSYCT